MTYKGWYALKPKQPTNHVYLMLCDNYQHKGILYQYKHLYGKVNKKDIIFVNRNY